jgi:corrinoid protein of di/trimethylamine methyltransferase
MMTHRERIEAAMRGEMADQLPYVPRIDLWYNANSLAGTLPEKHKGRTQDEISRAEGWALHKALPDLVDVRTPDAVLHRAIGMYETRQSVHRFQFSEDVDVRVTREGDSTQVEYHTPVGMVRTKTEFSDEYRRAGSTMAVITEHAIKGPEDYRVLAYIFENLKLTPTLDEFLEWQGEVGDDGFCCTYATIAGSPMHHIQKDFLDPTQFFFHYNDYHKEMQALAEALEPYYSQQLEILVDSPAVGVIWGFNFDDMITYPPYFEKDILPWLKKACAELHAKDKVVLSHCDGENLGLMDLIRDTDIDVAEAVCPYPMTKVRVGEYYQRWCDKLTVFGGIPSNILLAELCSDEEFEAYLDNLFRVIAPGTRFVVGVADTTPPDAVFERLIRIGERVEKEGRLPLAAGAARPVSQEELVAAEEIVTPQTSSEARYETVQADVFRGDSEAIGAHIQELLEQGVDADDVLEKGLIAAMDVIGPKFKAGELFIPEVLLSSRAMNQGLAVLEPHLSGEGKTAKGKVLIGTVKGDLHDIGKNMVATMLRGAGFEVRDLGIDVNQEAFIKEIEEHSPDVLALSALLTTTMPEMKRIVGVLSDKGLRAGVKIMIGGAPINAKYAQDIGADGYAADAGEAVALAKGLMKR